MPGHQRPATGEDLLVGAGAAQHLQRGEPGDRGDRIARERPHLHQEAVVADDPAVEMRHDVGPPGDRRQREAAADDLAERAEVGRHAVVGLRAAIGEAEAGDDLVEDQRDAVLRGDVADALQEAGRRRDQPLEGLEDHPAELVVVRGDQRLSRLEVVEGGDQHLLPRAFRDAGGIRHGDGEIRQALGRQAHQPPVGHAVVAALEFQDAVAAAEGAGDAHRVHVGLGPAADEADLLGAGHRVDDHLGQADAVLVVGEEGGAARHLRQHRLGHLRMRMADEHRAGAEQVVDILVARDVPDPAAAAFPDDDVRGEIAEAAGRQHPMRRPHQRLLVRCG